MKKDHIALPDSTLKRFRELNQKNFFYIDLSNNQILEKGPSAYQKIKGYYQKEFDDVCQRIETLMGNIHKEIDTIYKSRSGSFYTYEYLKSIAIDILVLQTVRRPDESNVLRLIPSALEATSPCVQKHLIDERYMLNKVQEYLLNNQNHEKGSCC